MLESFYSYKQEEYILYLENTDYYSLKKITNSVKLKDEDFLFTSKDASGIAWDEDDPDDYQNNKYYIDKIIKLSDILSDVVGG